MAKNARDYSGVLNVMNAKSSSSGKRSRATVTVNVAGRVINISGGTVNVSGVTVNTQGGKSHRSSIVERESIGEASAKVINRHIKVITRLKDR